MRRNEVEGFLRRFYEIYPSCCFASGCSGLRQKFLRNAGSHLQTGNRTKSGWSFFVSARERFQAKCADSGSSPIEVRSNAAGGFTPMQ